MLYLIDSGASSFKGHNLEYLDRLSSVAEASCVIIGSKELSTFGHPRYLGAFEHSTWDFGRFGTLIKKSKIQTLKGSKTLKPSRMLIVIEKAIETLCKHFSKFSRGLISGLSSFTRQSKSFHRDLSLALLNVSGEDTLIFSTVNARELVGLNSWLNSSQRDTFSISIILRRPFLDLRSLLEIPLLFADSLVYITAIQKLKGKVRFFADTPGLAARLTRYSGISISTIPALGFEPENQNIEKTVAVALAPNSRPETRLGIDKSSSIPELYEGEKSNLNSRQYRDLIASTKSLVLPYDPLRYRARSSGVFAEALTLGTLPIVPTGTSMSREISELNGKDFPAPLHTIFAKINTKISMNHFAGESFLVEIVTNFTGSVILEVTDRTKSVKAVHDFFEDGATDSFLIEFDTDTFFCFKTDRLLFNFNRMVTIRLYRILDALNGVPYLQGDLPNALTLASKLRFNKPKKIALRAHIPSLVWDSLRSTHAIFE